MYPGCPKRSGTLDFRYFDIRKSDIPGVPKEAERSIRKY